MAGEREVCSFLSFFSLFCLFLFLGVVLGMGTVNRAHVLFVIIGY